MFTNKHKSMTEASGSWLRTDLPANFALSTAQSNGTENRVKSGTELGGDLEVIGELMGISNEAIQTAIPGANPENALSLIRSGQFQEISVDPVTVYLSHLAPGSRRTMAQALSTLAKILSGGLADLHTFDWSCLTYEHTSTLPSLLSSEPHNLSPVTVNKMLSALRGCLRECANLKRMTWEQFNAATQIRCKVAHKEPPGRSLSRGELEALMEATEGDGVQAVRDRAILALLYGAGLRRAEAAALKLADYDPETGRILVRSGKGGKDRAVFLAGRRKAALDRWLELRDQEPGGLLQPTRAGKVWVRSGQCMTPDALFKVLERLGGSAGLKDFSPHDLRRSYISDLIDAGADLPAVQRLVGHASVNTTARYDRRGEAAAKKAAGMIDL